MSKAAYVVLGINTDGRKDILGIWIGQHESAKFWAGVLNDLKSRGVKDVYLFCVDGLMRGLGDSRWPLYAMIMSSVLNIILDLLFVIAFGWGVAGVAIATMVSYIASGFILLMRFIRGNTV